MDESTVYERSLDTSWVLTWKRDSSGLPFVMARLVVKDFRVLITASVDRKEQSLLIAPTAALEEWALLQLDIPAAFWGEWRLRTRRFR